MNESPFKLLIGRLETPIFAWGYCAVYTAIIHQLDAHMLSHFSIAAYFLQYKINQNINQNIDQNQFYRKAHMSSKKLLEQCQKLEKLWGHVLTGNIQANQDNDHIV